MRASLLLALALALAPACDDGGTAAGPAADTATGPDLQGPDAEVADTPEDVAAPEDTDPQADSTGPADVADADGASPQDTEVAAGDTAAPASPLVGRWAQLQVQSAKSEVPFVGEVTATTTTLLLVDLRAGEGGALTLRQSICDVTLDSGTALVSTVLPDATVAAIAPIERPVTFSAADSSVSFVGLTEVWGATLASPETEALPTDKSDPRVVDHEGDGKPGMTVRISGLLDGEIYLVQRGRTTLTGAFDGQDRVDGLIAWTQEQSILDTDNPLLKTPIPTTVDPDPTRSYFRTTRVSSAATCAEVSADAATLFAR